MFILFLLFLSALIVQGQFVNIDLAKTIGSNYYTYVSGKSRIEIEKIFTKRYNNTIVYYIINFKTGGYVIVSANKMAPPILGFSFNGKYSDNYYNPAFQDLMEIYSKEIVSRKIGENKKKYILAWNRYSTNIQKDRNITQVGPFIQTHWEQDDPYYILCPSENNCSNPHCATGCVATAMAQIIRYWQYPLYALSGGYYDYCNMPATTSEYNTPEKRYAVAKLMLDCGTASNMNYCFSDCESFTWPEDAANAFINSFNYEADIDRKEYYSDNTWITKLVNNLDNGYPILYFGLASTISFNGHSFIVDGYWRDDDFAGYDNEYMFHINWGWGINPVHDYDGWFYYGSFILDGDNYCHDDRAIFNLHPLSTADCNSSIEICNNPTNYYPVAGHIHKGLNCNITITQNEQAHYKAFNSIIIEAGNGDFVVENGADFVAEIVPCPLCDLSRNLNTYTSNNFISDNFNIDTIYMNQSKDEDFYLKIHPNPTTDAFTISINTSDNIQFDIEIKDVFGKTVVVKYNMGNNAQVDISSLKSGVYFVKIKMKDYEVVKKIIKS